ncbi:MAG TPA: hypothetical protein VF428_00115 [Casimicrobiaceae bacterium]
MHAHRPTGWLRPLLTLAALAGVLSLAACGGGGGSPSNPYQPGGSAPSVAPSTANIYSQIPYVFTVTGGTQPYRITSGNPNDLHVPAEAVGNTFAVLGAAVTAPTTESLTVTDALGRAATATVTINPAVLLPTSITITGNPNCAASGATLCSGQDGSASVTATGANGVPLAGRAIRFDVVQGDYTISPPGQAPATSFTVTTDQNGVAAVRLLVAVTAPTQIATIRATDIASGESIVGQFTIAQYTNGSATLTVLPSTVAFTGPDKATCNAGGQASFYIFGGTPPYTVASTAPQVITIKGAPVLKSGGSFTITTTGVCTSNDGVTLIITDASGRVATSPTVTNGFGSADAPPPALVVTPASLSGTCSAGSTFTFLATGGTGTYTNSINPQPAGVTVTPTGANVAVSFSSAVSATTFNITVSSGSQAVLAKLTCN